jgi:hypothetical protein
MLIMKKNKVTPRQELTFSAMMKAIEAGEGFSLQELMTNNGYAPATAHNPGKNLVRKEGWQQLMSQIDDGVILAKIYEVLLDKDKDGSLKAADMLLKLKDRYPAQKSKIVGLFDKISALE